MDKSPLIGPQCLQSVIIIRYIGPQCLQSVIIILKSSPAPPAAPGRTGGRVGERAAGTDPFTAGTDGRDGRTDGRADGMLRARFSCCHAYEH